MGVVEMLTDSRGHNLCLATVPNHLRLTIVATPKPGRCRCRCRCRCSKARTRVVMDADYDAHISRVRSVELPALYGQALADGTRTAGLYLDAAGMPPTPISGVRAWADDMAHHFYANPHSLSAAGVHAANMVEQARHDVLTELFSLPADGGGWDLVFTSGTTSSLQLVAQSFAFSSASTGPQMAHLLEAHTSVVGLRGIAQHRGVEHCALTEGQMAEYNPWTEEHLAILPLQCNATGRKYNQLLTRLCSASPRPRILLDAAAYLSSNRMQLPAAGQEAYDSAPDFIAFSLYKVYGAPTGLGGLVVKSVSGSALRAKPYYGGGTVSVLLPQAGVQVPRPSSLPARFEDGTINVHGIVALRHAMAASKRILGPWDKQAAHLRFLAHRLHTALAGVRHANGRPAVRILASSRDAAQWVLGAGTANPNNDQGPTAAFVLSSSTGARVPAAEFARLASLANVHVRVGRHCNAGVAVSLTLRPEGQSDPPTAQQVQHAESALWKIYEAGSGCDTAAQAVIDAPESCPLSRSSVYAAAAGRAPAAAEPDEDDPAASIRASLSVWNTASDVDELIEFITLYFVDHTAVDAETHTTATLDIQEEAKTDLVLKMATLYPIKSCAGQELPVTAAGAGAVWPVTRLGLLHDREWCIIDLETGRAISQKREPRMATIRPRVDWTRQVLEIRLPRIHCAARGRQEPVPYQTPVFPEPPANLADDDVLLISFGAGTSGDQNLRVCADDVLARVYDTPDITDAFSRFLGRRATLARLAPDQAHRHSKFPVPSEGRSDGLDGSVPAPAPILLANESPFLLLHQDALEAVAIWIEKDLATKGEKPLSNLHWRNVARRFRANMVVGPANEDDTGSGERSSTPLSLARSASTLVTSDADADADAGADGAAVRRKRLRLDERTEGRSSPPSSQPALPASCTKSNASEAAAAAAEADAEAGAWCPLPGDGLKRITVGGETFVSLGPCRRCQMVAIDQWTGRKLPQTLLSISTRRRAATGRVVFGTHLAWAPDARSRAQIALDMPVVATFDTSDQ